MVPLWLGGLGGCRRHQRAQRGRLEFRGWAENIDQAPNEALECLPTTPRLEGDPPEGGEGSGVRARSLVHLRDKYNINFCSVFTGGRGGERSAGPKFGAPLRYRGDFDIDFLL